MTVLRIVMILPEFIFMDLRDVGIRLKERRITIDI